MKRIIYIISGSGHAPNLVVSLFTLRSHYGGQVDVFVWPESEQIVKRVCQDPYLNVGCIPWKPLFRGHSDTYVDKTRLIQSLPNKDESVLFLDADTTIHESLQPLFDGIKSHGFVATQFNDWVSNGSIIGGRIRTLREFPEIDKDLIDAALAKPWPSVNSGIFGGRPDSPIHELWHRWTNIARGTYIPDEKVLHLMLPKFAPSDQIIVATGGQWNCSPMLSFQPKALEDKDVIIRHYHGDCNLRPNKSPKGAAQWRPLFDHCLKWNIGGMHDWLSKVHNKHLTKFLEPENASSSVG